MDQARILVADDEESMRFLLREVMTREGYEVVTASNGQEAVDQVRAQEFDLAILDVKMPQMDGITALREIRAIRPQLTVLMMTAFGGTQTALEAIKQGAYDFFTKPFELDEMRVVVRRALEKQQLVRQIANLEQRLLDRISFDRIIGQSEAMREVYAILEKVITNDVTVLITGESGTGKELVAQAVHFHSHRKSKPFVSVNCAAIPETLLESELFGHERGAFTGAVGTTIGRFEAANGGSIFLDEIGEMPLALQSKLLRVLQEREIMRVGGSKPIKVDIRIIAATNRRLEECVEAKTFREDLFFRLNVLPIRLPALRQRRSDIPLLVNHFVNVYNPRLGKSLAGVTPEAMQALENYPWPGNVRELENVIQRAMILATGNLIRLEDLPANVVSGQAAVPVSGTDGAASASAAPTVLGLQGKDASMLLEDFSTPLQEKLEQIQEDVEKRIIVAALNKCNFHRQDTADLLGISRKSLHNKMVKYQLFGDKGGGGDEG